MFTFLLPKYNNILVGSFLFALFNEPEVFLPKYSQTALLHAAYFRRVVTRKIHSLYKTIWCVPVLARARAATARMLGSASEVRSFSCRTTGGVLKDPEGTKVKGQRSF